LTEDRDLSQMTRDGDDTVMPANMAQPHRNHLSLGGDSEHACSDALLVWQKSAKHYYRSYLLHLLRRARHVGVSSGKNCQANRMWDEEVTDLLHLSLFLIIEEESKRSRSHCHAKVNLNLNLNRNLNHHHTRGGDCEGSSKDGGLLDGSCALGCCTEKYENIKTAGEDTRHGKRSGKSEIAIGLQTVRSIIRHSSGLNYSNTASTATLCAAYGCHKEALRACRNHLSHQSGEGKGERESEVRAVLLQSLQMSLCRLVRGTLHEQTVAFRSCRPDHDRDAGSTTATTAATAAASPSSSSASRAQRVGSMSSEASGDVELAVKLLWVSLVRSEGGGGGDADNIGEIITPDSNKDDTGRIVDMVLGPIISCIMSSPLCLCPSTALKMTEDGSWTGSRDRGSNGHTQKQGAESSAEKGVEKGVSTVDLEVCLIGYLKGLCTEDSTQEHGGLTMELLYSSPHEPSEDTHDFPVPDPCLPLLRSLKAAVSATISRCVLAALGSVLTRKFVRALPPLFSDHLDIDYFADLDD
jgi:hypothetical protein